jgi:hypothetical protein
MHLHEGILIKWHFLYATQIKKNIIKNIKLSFQWVQMSLLRWPIYITWLLHTEQSGVAITFYIYTWKVFGSNLCQDNRSSWHVYRGFPRSLKANVGITPRPLPTPLFTSALDGGESSVSWPGERATGTDWIGGWVGPRSGVNTVEKREISCTRWESNPGRPYRTYTEWATPVRKTISCNYADWIHTARGRD